MNINDRQKILNLFSDISEDFITGYHNDLLYLIDNELKDIENEIKEEHNHEEKIRLLCLKSRFENHVDELANSTFLMFYSYAEEWIFLKIYRTRYSNLISNRGSITRFKEPLSKLGVDISKQDWSIMAEAEYIRDCLSHANGRYDLACLKNKKLKRIVESKKSSDFFQLKNKRLYISREYLNHYKNAIRNILHHPDRAISFPKKRSVFESFWRVSKAVCIKIKRNFRRL